MDNMQATQQELPQRFSQDASQSLSQELRQDASQSLSQELRQDALRSLPQEHAQTLAQTLPQTLPPNDFAQNEEEACATPFFPERIEQLLQMLLAKDASPFAQPATDGQAVRSNEMKPTMKGRIPMPNQTTGPANQSAAYENSADADTQMYDFVLQLMQQAEQEKEKESARKQRQEWNDRDLNEFTTAHPDVDLASLLRENPRFSKFGRGRFGTLPLNEIFNDFLEFCSESERAALARNQDRRERTTGSGSGGLVSSLTPSQSAALADWNQSNPDLAMTPKEFLSR